MNRSHVKTRAFVGQAMAAFNDWRLREVSPPMATVLVPADRTPAAIITDASRLNARDGEPMGGRIRNKGWLLDSNERSQGSARTGDGMTATTVRPAIRRASSAAWHHHRCSAGRRGPHCPNASDISLGNPRRRNTGPPCPDGFLLEDHENSQGTAQGNEPRALSGVRGNSPRFYIRFGNLQRMHDSVQPKA